MSQTIINSYKSIVILGGTLPSKKVLERINWRNKVIAADGALIKAQECGIKVDYLVGDLDTIHSAQVDVPGEIKVYYDPDQHSSDFEKCITIVRAEKLVPALIIGLNGGEIDHIIGNIHMLVKHHLQDGEFFFLDDDGINVKMGMVLTHSRRISCAMGKNISIFPYPEAVITTVGLQYPLNQAHINQTSGVLCSRNKTIASEIEIIIYQGAVLVIVDIIF